ncbi:membrane protein FAM174A-like [Schistocerca serialis cubense]|uniref:membrane protein FAM174A-like n=1 Tax=Schistocerca serialis cubense TaxID=2023355 RepID=UPI00214E8F7F|nr:membrane protein FAM174A-like [Schistocerca serialis cubense]
MLGNSIRITAHITVSCVLLCSLILCSAKTDIGNAHESFSRLPRSEPATDVKLHEEKQKSSVSVRPPAQDKKNKDVTPSTNVSHANNVTVTEQSAGEQTGGRPQRNLNSGALLRGFSVFVGLSAIVVIYIVIRAISMRRKKTTVRKYGILTNREDVEMTPLGAEDDEEDTTLFDVSNQTRP